MPKLQIEGKTVEVGDDFLRMNTDQQNAAVEEIAANLRVAPDPKTDPSGALSTENVVRATARGVPIIGGALNKANAATNAVLSPLIEPFMSPSESDISRNGETLPERYRKSLDMQNQRDAAFEAQHPVIDTAAEIAGGVGATLPVAATSAGAKFLGMSGTLPQMIRRGTTSGALIGGADAAVRGQDPTTGAEVGAALNAVAPVLGRVAGKAIQKFRGNGATVPQVTERVGNTEVPLTQSQVTGDAAQSAEEQILRRGGRGEPAQQVTQDFEALQNQRLAAASDEISAGLDPTGASLRTAPQDAAQRVSSELGDAQAQRAAAQMSADAATAREGAALRGDLATPTGRPGNIADTPLAAAELIGTSIRNTAQVGRDMRTSAYRALGDTPGEFAPAAFQRIGQSVRNRLGRGDNPVVVSDTLTPNAAEMLRDLDANIGGQRFQNNAANGAATLDASGRPVAPPITAQTVEEARKRLVSFAADARKAARSGTGTGPADFRAAGRILDAFDEHMGDAVRAGAFSGDSAAYQAAQQRARGSHRNYRQTFAARAPDDDAGKIFEKVIGRLDGEPAAPSELANKMFGSASDPGGGLAVRFAQRLRDLYGADSREWAAYRQGLLAHITDTTEGLAARDPNKTADRVLKFLNGTNGRGLAQVAFSPAERQRLGGYAAQVRATAPAPKPTSEIERVMARISGADGSVPASPTEIADYLFSRSGAGNRGVSVRLAERLKQELSPEGWTSVRQGMWQKLINAGEGKIEFGPQKLSQRLHEFLNESGKPLAEALYSAQERAQMAQLAKVYKQMIPVPGTTNPSGTAPMLKKIADKSTNTLLALLGFSHGGLPGAALAMGAEHGLRGIRNSRAAGDAVKRFYGAQPAAPIDPRAGRAFSVLTQGASPAGIDQRR